MIEVMHYNILNTNFQIDQNVLFINQKRQDIKNITLETLVFFLNSNGKIVSKDEILTYVWKGIIVSDSSIFKQVELVRKLFVKASLPKDVIETIYKKGYKLKYKVNKTSEISKKQSEKAPFIKQRKISYLAVFSLVVICLVGIVVYLNFNKTTQVDYLTMEKRESLVKLMNNNWQVGLVNIQSLLNDKLLKLSKSDRAFLYGKEGRAHYHLLHYEFSLDAYEKALELFLSLNDDRHSGKTHLNIAATLRHLPHIENYLQLQLEHINKAIIFLEKSNSPILIIDAQMELAHYYRDNGKIENAIKFFEKTVVDAKRIDDATGVMIASNNLASTYLIDNNYEKAIELGQLSLSMALEIGGGRYIASSYSLLSELYQHQYRSKKALKMIELAIKNQLSNNEFSHLGPKLFTLNYILVQTYQYKLANEMLNLTESFVKNQDSTLSLGTIALYRGINAARELKWKEAQGLLSQALLVSQRSNFKYKQALNKAYLSLALFFNENSLKAIEKAKEVLNDKKSDKQSRAIAALTLAYSYSYLEKPPLSSKWLEQVEKNQNPKWLFEYKLYLQLKLENQESKTTTLSKKITQEILKTQKKMLHLSKSVIFDRVLYDKLSKLLIKKSY
jgi:DNA-binding winged helix-turn-helix (wHTH) protein